MLSKIKEYFSQTTTYLALLLSFWGASGFLSLIGYIACHWDADITNHPLMIPGTFILGTISFFVCVIVFCIYVTHMIKKPSFKKVLADIFLVILTFIPFLNVVGLIIEIVSNIVHFFID